MSLFRRSVVTPLVVGGIILAGATTAVAEPTGGTGPDDATASPLSAAATAMPQTDKTIYALGYSNGVLYLGGTFTTTRPAGAAAGTQTTAQPRLAAVNTTTNKVISSWTPQVSGGAIFAMAVSPDGKRLYVGGTFNHIDGKFHNRIAGFDITDPKAPVLLPAKKFNPTPNKKIVALAATNTTVYAGGYLTSAGGAARTDVAAFSADGGATLPWKPVLAGVSAPSYPNPFVTSLAVTPDGSRVAIGGLFDKVNGVSQHGLAMVDATTGASVPGYQIPSILPTSYITAIAMDGGRMFIAGRDDKSGNSNRHEGVRAMDLATGATLWGSDGHRCLGDSFALQVLAGQVWVGTHAHNCSAIGGHPEMSPRFYGSTMGQDVVTGTQDHFYPATYGNKTVQGSMNNVRAFATDGSRLFVAGGFLRTDGVKSQDLVSFDPKNGGGGAVPTKVGRPKLSTTSAGVKVSWTAASDVDDRNLTYRVYRNKGTTAIGTVTAASTFWSLPTISFVDSGATPGASVTYKVAVSDGSNNAGKSVASNSITVPAAPASYAQAVLADSPELYWRFDESGGSTTADASGHNDLGRLTGGTFGATGVSAGGVTLTGGQHVYSQVARTSPNGFTEEVWFRSTSTQGGRIMGFGNATSGTSTQYDRHVYMTDGGQLVFGTYSGTPRTITSPGSYNDGQWHHVVVTQGADGQTMYVDGGVVASSTFSKAENGTLYFRVGSDNVSSWPSQPSSQGLAGTFDEAAFYATELLPAQVAAHYDLGRP
jgi:hypothetical protein